MLLAFCSDTLRPRVVHHKPLPRIRTRIELVDESRASTNYRCQKANLPQLMHTVFSLLSISTGVAAACPRRSQFEKKPRGFPKAGTLLPPPYLVESVKGLEFKRLQNQWVFFVYFHTQSLRTMIYSSGLSLMQYGIFIP